MKRYILDLSEARLSANIPMTCLFIPLVQDSPGWYKLDKSRISDKDYQTKMMFANGFDSRLNDVEPVYITQESLRKTKAKILTACLWQYDENNYYEASCDRGFCLTTSLEEAGYYYCPGCGKPIEVIK